MDRQTEYHFRALEKHVFLSSAKLSCCPSSEEMWRTLSPSGDVPGLRAQRGETDLTQLYLRPNTIQVSLIVLFNHFRSNPPKKINSSYLEAFSTYLYEWNNTKYEKYNCILIIKYYTNKLWHFKHAAKIYLQTYIQLLVVVLTIIKIIKHAKKIIIFYFCILFVFMKKKLSETIQNRK